MSLAVVNEVHTQLGLATRVTVFALNCAFKKEKKPGHFKLRQNVKRGLL